MWFWVVVVLLLGLLWDQCCASSRLLKDEYWRGLVVQPRGNYSFAENNLHKDADILSLFSVEDIQLLNNIITKFLNYPNDEMWSHVDDVSVKQPFILFHQRKAGGSSLRQTLNFAANQLNIPSFFPCRNKIPCDTYHLPKEEPYAVYGGHFHWGVQDELGRFDRSLRRSFQCTTNFRHPLDRIESCFYFRFGSYLNNTCLNDLSAAQFEELVFKLDPFGTSCINEPFRALSGLHDEEVIDSLMMSRITHRPVGNAGAPLIAAPATSVPPKASKSKTDTAPAPKPPQILRVFHDEDAVILGGKPDHEDHQKSKSKFSFFKSSSGHSKKHEEPAPSTAATAATATTISVVDKPAAPHTITAAKEPSQPISPSDNVQTTSQHRGKSRGRSKAAKVDEGEDFEIQGGKDDRRRRLQQHIDPKQVMVVFNNTLSHVVRCPPVVLELPGTFNLLDDRIPKLGEVGGFQSGYQANSGDKATKKCTPLDGDRLKKIKEHAALEMLLYDAVVRKTSFHLSKSYEDYVLQMKCASSYRQRGEIVPPMTPPLPHTRSPPLLISDHDDMSINMRRIIEYSTGFIVGSLATRQELVNAFAGESLCHHVKTLAVFAEPSDVVARLHPDTMHPYFNYHGVYNRKCNKFGSIKQFEKAIVLINDPFFVIYESIAEKESPTDQYQAVLDLYDQRAFDSDTMFASFSAEEGLLEKAFYEQAFALFVSFPVYKSLFHNFFTVYHNETTATSIHQRASLMKHFQASKLTPKYLSERYKFISPLAVLTEAKEHYQLLINQTTYDVANNSFMVDETKTKPKFVQTPDAYQNLLQYLLGERMNEIGTWPDWRLSCSFPNIQGSSMIHKQLRRYNDARRFYIGHPKIYQKAKLLVNQWASLIGLHKEQFSVMFPL